MNDALESFVPMTLARRGVQQLATTDAPAFDATLLQGLGRAFYWKHLLDSGIAKSGSDIARQEGLHHSCINELMRLTLLAPDIIAQLMTGLTLPLKRVVLSPTITRPFCAVPRTSVVQTALG